MTVAIPRYLLSGERIGEMDVAASLLQQRAHPQMIKDYLVALGENRRQFSAHSKTRAEVAHSKQKPHPQKGTGRARQGSLAAPQYKGGGRVFAPRARHKEKIRINRQQKRAVIRFLLAQRIKDGQAAILSLADDATLRTQQLARFLRQLQILDQPTLFLGSSSSAAQRVQRMVRQSMHNLPRKCFRLLIDVDGYHLYSHRRLLLLEAACDDLLARLQSQPC